MANQVQDIVLRLKNEGFEAIDKIRSSFRELGKVTNFTETDLQRIRKEILNFGASADRTTQSLRGQVEALKAVQGQATINSRVYSQLGKDIKDLNVAYKEAATGVTQFSDAQLKAQKAGARPTIFTQQIAALKKDLQNLSVYSKEYSALLTKISRRELPFNLAQGRQNVIAAEAAYRLGPDLFNPDTVMPTMPDTTAALSQRYQELSARLSNVVRGSSEYINTSIELANIQRQIREELVGTANAYTDLASKQRQAAKIEQVRQYNESRAVAGMPSYLSGLTAPYRDPTTGVMIAPGGLTLSGGIRPKTQYPSPLTVPEASPLFASIGNIASQASINSAQLMQRSYEEVAGSIRRVSAASDGSLNSLRAQRQAWELLRNTLGDNRTALRAVDKELTDLDRKIEARGRPRARQGFTGLGAAQTAGAVISGGIFGGPEGLLGGVLGAAGGFLAGGGPAALGGAFAGSAIGAQVGAFRQSLAGATEYAAQIDKLRLALKGIVGDEKSYREALSASFTITRDLNVPQEVAIQNLTKLSAAVLGAGGTVKDSSFAFRALTEAVKATGGSAEQVDGAVLALTQIFSKGKVSAEELNQIAERLPGAFTLFAKAAGKTGPELQKALQQGQVGLNDLAKFLEALSQRYGQSALDIAKSSQEAGARLEVTFGNLRKAIGDVLQPIGKEFQNAFADFLIDIGPGVVTTVNLVGKAIQGLFRIFSGGINIVKSLSGAIKVLSTVLITLAGAQAGAFAVSNIGLFTSGIKNLISFTRQLVNLQRIALAIETARASLQAIITGLSTGAMRGKLAGAILGGGLAAGAAIFGIPKLLEYVNSQVSASIEKSTRGFTGPAPAPATGIDTQFAAPSSDKAQKAREDAAKKALADAQAAYDQRQQLNMTLAKNEIELAKTVFEAKQELTKREYELRKELQELSAEAFLTSLSGAARESYGLAVEYSQRIEAINRPVKDAAADVEKALQNLRYARAMERVSLMAPGISDTPISPAPAAGLSAAQLRAYSNPNISANSPYYPIGQMVGGDTPTRQRGQAVSQMRQYISATTDVEQAVVQLTFAEVALSQLRESAAAKLPLLEVIYTDKLTKAYKQQTEALIEATEVDTLRLQQQRLGIDPAVINYNVEILKLRRQFTADIQGQKAALDQGTQTQTDYAKNINSITTAATNNAKALRDNAEAAYKLDTALRRVQDAQIGRGFQEGVNQYIESIGTLRSATADLAQNGIKGIEDAIFSLVTTGTANFREFAANILQETARVIIRQLILRTVLQSIFPSQSQVFPDLSKTFTANANGNIFASNGIQPFAMGGIVNQPTLFRYANGGVPGLGLMGEAGPEAIVPLQRGANGKLGIAGGGGTYNVTVNVEAGGATTQTQGDPGQGAQLGRLIAGAVQAELIKQQRPGGLLAQR